MFDHLTFTLAQSDPAVPSEPAPTNPDPTPTDPALTDQSDAQQAKEGTVVDPNGKKVPPQTKPEFDFTMLLLPLALVVFFVFMMNGSKREKKKRQKMMDTLKKNDKVITIGGIIGIVVDVKDTEVVLKVDESSNTRMRFSRNSIQGVVADED